MTEKNTNNENFKTELLAIRREIGIKLRHRRLYVGLETKVLATKVGLSQGSISNIEKGKQAITAERLWQFCIALSCSSVDLLPSIPDEFKDYDNNLKKIDDEKGKEFAKKIIINASN